jgi:hypothetical protein
MEMETEDPSPDECPTVGANSCPVDNIALQRLSDKELMARTEFLARLERSAACDLVLHISELDRRESLIKSGFNSTFDYCVHRLRYAEGAAYRLIRAARAVRRMPPLEPLLREGALTLEAVALIHPYLKDADASALVQSCVGRSTRYVEALVAKRRTAPSIRDSIRHIGTKPSSDSPAKQPLGAPLVLEPGRGPDPYRPEREMVRIVFAAGGRFEALLRRAKSVMLHKYPEGRLEDVLSDALEALLDKKDMDRIVARRAKWRQQTAARRRAAGA